jgi:hypothetical protein
MAKLSELLPFIKQTLAQFSNQLQEKV